MGSEVLYRKWRPQTLAEVVGQEPVTQTLRRAVEGGKVAHAYLFCGPRGTGKTSTGRILAKAVNCANQVGGEPCNACDMCRSITEGSALDVIEIDAASNRGIDDIRSLREKVNYAPSIGRYRVYITDEVHMLTEPAANALLKTLEEPPGHVIFVLATTEPHQVPPTIVSRCQRFSFHRLSQAAIKAKLALICEKEGVRIGEESLGLVARASTGSLRDAENILQQLMTYYGDEIGLDQVQSALGQTGDSRVPQLAKHIVDRDIPAGLHVINDVNSDGIDLRQFNLELLGYLRGLLLVKSDCEEAVDVTREDLTEMRSLVAGTTLDYLLTIVKAFSSVDYRSEGYSALPLELALVGSALPSTGEQPAATTERSEPASVASPSQESTQPFPEAGVAEAAGDAKDSSEENLHGFEYVRSHWKDLVRSLRGEGSSGSLDAFLRSACEPVGLEDDTLVLGFYYAFHKEKIEDPKYKYLVERKLKEVFGQPYKIRCILVDEKKGASSRQQTGKSLLEAAVEMGAKIEE